MAGSQLRIRIDVERTGDSPRGRISDDTGATKRFAGWLGLVSALDALVSGARPTGPTDGPEPVEIIDRANRDRHA
ncbi:MAG TPA: hypothetical protein VI122_12720 [Thermoleophilaceae bacterium]